MGTLRGLGIQGLVFLSTVVLVFGGVSDKMESDFFDNPEINLQLSHFFGPNDQDANSATFTPRGSVVIRSFKGPRFTTNQKDLSEDELKQLEKLADSDGYYFIKASVKTPAGEKVFRSFASAKALLQSGLSDMIRIHVNPSGEIVAVSYSLSTTNGASRKQKRTFNTTVSIHHGELGPQPDTAPYLEKLEMERLAKERGEDPRDNRSFLAKYWMYLVPIGIMILISGAGNQES